MPISPPRLLAGATLLFWGGMTGNALLGLLAALLLEARSWAGLRWDFNRGSYIKAWQFSILCGALISILAWVNGVKAGKIHTLFVWAPLILLPLELAQRYGKSKNIPLNTFSFFARKKMEHDIRQGRSVSPRMINTGYPYIAVVLLATAMASRNEIHHFIGLALVIGACLFFYMWKSGFRFWAWASALILTLFLSYISQWGMFKLYHYFTEGEGAESGQHTSANESRTSIGRLGRIKLSPKIFWRMKVSDGNVPKLLRTATYNEYSRARWLHSFQESEDRDELDYIGSSIWSGRELDDRNIRGFTEDDPLIVADAPITIIGEVDSSVIENPLPLPHFMLAIGDLGEEADIECNSLGTVRMANPEYHVVEYSVWTGDDSTTEEPGDGKFDLSIPEQEAESIARICTQLGLKEDGLSTRAKIRKLRHFFNTQFIYSTHLNTPAIDSAQRKSAIGIFLETTKSGHCEYFATASALLLREAGVPTRYCVGFSVNERDSDRGEWIMRGQHAHAWCRVWIDDHWEDLDLTPPAWTTLDTGREITWQSRLSDWWQRFREDFLIWRTKAANKTKVFITIATVLSLLLMWISWRLWQSRQRGTRSRKSFYSRPETAVTTPLHKLEPLVAKKIGPRPNGTPLCQWLEEVSHIEPSLRSDLQRATALHSAIRFDPQFGLKKPNKDTCDELLKICRSLKKRIKQAGKS